MFWDVNVGQNISGGSQGAFTVIGKANTFFTSPCPESECHRPLPTIYSPLAVKNAPSLSSLGKLTIWDNTSLLWWAWIYRTWCSLTHLCSILVLVILHHLHASRNFFTKTQKEGKLNLSGIKKQNKTKMEEELIKYYFKYGVGLSNILPCLYCFMLLATLRVIPLQLWSKFHSNCKDLTTLTHVEHFCLPEKTIMNMYDYCNKISFAFRILE